jgi:hypothetical protein
MKYKELIEAHGLTLHGDIEHFAALVEAQERKSWEYKFARLQNLMDVREIQPNKPCCLAARADEREECAKVCEEDGLLWGQRYAAAIRARGTT